jgi:hypothetical protein
MMAAGVWSESGKTGWFAGLSFKSRTLHLGTYETEEQAAEAYDR